MPFDATAFREAAQESGSGDAPPDGLYDAEVVEAKIATRNSDGVQWAAMTFRVMSGPHRDKQWTSMWTLERFKADGERSGGFPITVQSLRTMGVDVDNVFSEADLKSALRGLEDGIYHVEVKTNGQFTNTNPRSIVKDAQSSLPGSGGDTPAYGQPRNAIMGDDAGGPSVAPPQSMGEQATVRRDIERTGESDVTTPADVAAFDRSTAPARGSVDPETGEEIPF